MPDQIIGSGADGTTNPILQENDPLWELLITGDEPDQKADEAISEPEAEVDLEDVDQVYGISFPKDMLPIKTTSGIWESEPILDMDGNEETALVRVWLYPPEGRS